MTKKSIFMALLLGVFSSFCNVQKTPIKKTFFISSETEPCSAGVRMMDCMLLKSDKNAKQYIYFYEEIEGFAHEKGYEYEVIVTEEEVKNPPADASNTKYKLVKVVSKKFVGKSLYISSKTKPCRAGVMKMDCMQVKESKNQKEWNNFYGTIVGFTYKKGYEYKLAISEEKIENPPADAPNVSYKLIKIISKKKNRK